MGPFTVGQIPAQPEVFTINDGSGNARDLTVYSQFLAHMTNNIGGSSLLGATFDPIDPQQVNRLVMHWPSNATPFASAGTYQLQLEFKNPTSGADDFSGIAAFQVEPASGGISIPMWASVTDVAQVTGQSVSNDILITAQMIIDSVTNRTPAASGRIQARDLIWLNRALCYQAVWMAGQPDIFTRTQLTQVSQDGISAVFADKGSVFIGPLAQRALKNISWMKTRSLRLQTPFIDGDIGTATNAEANDLLDSWAALGTWS